MIFSISFLVMLLILIKTQDIQTKHKYYISWKEAILFQEILWMSTKIKWGPLLSWSFLEGKCISRPYLALKEASSFPLKRNMKAVVCNFPTKTHFCWGYLFQLCLFMIIMNTLSPLPCVAQGVEKLPSQDTSVAPRIIRTKKIAKFKVLKSKLQRDIKRICRH